MHNEKGKKIYIARDEKEKADESTYNEAGQRSEGCETEVKVKNNAKVAQGRAPLSILLDNPKKEGGGPC